MIQKVVNVVSRMALLVCVAVIMSGCEEFSEWIDDFATDILFRPRYHVTATTENEATGENLSYEANGPGQPIRNNELKVSEDGVTKECVISFNMASSQFPEQPTLKMDIRFTVEDDMIKTWKKYPSKIDFTTYRLIDGEMVLAYFEGYNNGENGWIEFSKVKRRDVIYLSGKFECSVSDLLNDDTTPTKACGEFKDWYVKLY